MFPQVWALLAPGQNTLHARMCDLREKPVDSAAPPRLMDLEALGLNENQLTVPEEEGAEGSGL